ncbi:MAG: hypothetical protein ACLU99_12390 [Alphaproteobacteria bacterium]
MVFQFGLKIRSQDTKIVAVNQHKHYDSCLITEVTTPQTPQAMPVAGRETYRTTRNSPPVSATTNFPGRGGQLRSITRMSPF